MNIRDPQVRFRCKNTRDGGAHRVMQLEGEEFLRRFLLHVLPKGLMRIRHYGWLANRCRRACLARIRASLERANETEPQQPQESSPMLPFDGYRCPRCHQGRLRVRGRPAPLGWAGAGSVLPDSG